MYLNMKLKNLFHIIAIIFLTLFACRQDKLKEGASNDLKIRLSVDSTAIELYNVSAQIIHELQADSLEKSQWINFLAVYEDTSDQELRDFQPALDGTYTMVNNLIRFMPSKEFINGKLYFARCYTKILLREPRDIISGQKLSSSGGFIEYKFKINRANLMD